MCHPSFLWGMRHMPHSNEKYTTFICVTSRIHVRDMTWDLWHCSLIWHDVRDMPHLYAKLATFICVSWHICMCSMPHSNKRHTTFKCVASRIHACDMTWNVWHYSVIWHDVCDMPYSYVGRTSNIYVTCLIHMQNLPRLYVCQDMIWLYVWHDSLKWQTYHIYMCDMPKSYVWHDLICVTYI